MSRVEGFVCVGALPSELCPAGRLQCCSSCGLDCEDGLCLLFAGDFAVLRGLLMVPVGTMGSF